MLLKRIMSPLTATILTISLAGSVLAAPIEYGEELKNSPQTTPYVSFTDLPQTHWAYNYIANMVQKKVLEGYVDNKFRPENTITRAEFATIIVRASGITAAKVNYASFSDVPATNWASPFVESVKDYMTGYRLPNGQYNFNPDIPATREDITVAIVKLKGYDMRLANRAAVEPMFKDFASVSESAKDYVSIAVKEGLVSGYEDETFRGQATITRAEASALLYRAFLYGNDNKGVGGQTGSSTTPTVPTTTETPATANPQTTPTPTPSTPVQPQQPPQTAKFSVDTLVGGAGQGDVDGSVNAAKINAVDSLVMDKDDNIYFLDQDKKKVRKFNKSNGSVETLKTINSEFNWDMSNEGKITRYDYSYVYPKKLAYNNVNNGLYVLGYSIANNNSITQIFQLMPTITLSTYGPSSGTSKQWYRFFRFDDKNNFVYGTGGDDDYYGDKNSSIYTSQSGTKADLIATSKDNTGVAFSYDRYSNLPYPMDIISLADKYIMFDSGKRILSKVQIYPRRVETIASFDNISFDSVIAYNSKFYLSSGTTIYELTIDGKLTTFIDGKDLTYNDGNPIMKISHLSFDSNGNVIIYDDQNKAIRRINL